MHKGLADIREALVFPARFQPIRPEFDPYSPFTARLTARAASASGDATARLPIARPTVMPTPECITATVVASSTDMTENGAGPCAPYTPCQRSTRAQPRAQRLREARSSMALSTAPSLNGARPAVLVRIADDQLAVGRADQQVDAVIQQHGRARLDHLARSASGRQVRRTPYRTQDRPVNSGRSSANGADSERRAQHLQARDLQVQRREAFRQQRQVIMAGADEHMITTELAGVVATRPCSTARAPACR